MTSPKTVKNSIVSIIYIVLFLFYVQVAVALPTGPTITLTDNTTKGTTPGTIVNASINGTISPGGYIFTANLNGVQQNNRWKGYLGNVTGTLTLDDASDNTIFQWSLTDVSGEIYATRTSGTVNWSGINCTWIADGQTSRTTGAGSNRSPEHNENVFLSHTSSDDNISATFSVQNHSEMDVGGVVIGKDECFGVSTYQNNVSQTFGDSDNANFTQIVLYDGAPNTHDGNVVYATQIYDDLPGYDTTNTYDFQMILPEDSSSGFASSTPYYFYVELT